VAKNEKVRHQVLKDALPEKKKKVLKDACSKKKTTEAYTKRLDQQMEIFFMLLLPFNVCSKKLAYDKAVCIFLEDVSRKGWIYPRERRAARC